MEHMWTYDDNPLELGCGPNLFQWTHFRKSEIIRFTFQDGTEEPPEFYTCVGLSAQSL